METSSAPLLTAARDVENDVEHELEYSPPPRRPKSRRGPLGTTLCVLTAVGLLAAVVTVLLAHGPSIVSLRPLPAADGPDVVTSVDVWRGRVSELVNGEPTEHVKGESRTRVLFRRAANMSQTTSGMTCSTSRHGCPAGGQTIS